MKVLIIENEPATIDFMLTAFEVDWPEVKVVIANEGTKGLELVESEAPDIVLLDLGLPDIDGQTLVALVKRTPELKHIPVVAVTAWPEETARAMAMAYGCDGFISKPINTRTFPQQIAQFLVKR